MSPTPVLITGFEPFDGDSVNPSLDLARSFADTAGVATASLPVDRVLVVEHLRALLAEHAPDVVICLGQGTGRAAVELETTARNHIDFGGRTDNGGHHARGEELIPGGASVLCTTLPVDAFAVRQRALDRPVALSHDAGRHLCNATYYRLLSTPGGPRTVFVHVPLLPEQAARRGRGEASLAPAITRPCIADLIAALQAPRPAHPPR